MNDQLVGAALIEAGMIDTATLNQTLIKQEETGTSLQELLITAGLITEEDLLIFLAAKFNIPYVNLLVHDFKTTTIELLPLIYAQKYKAIILDHSESEVLVGMSDPMDINASDAISKILKTPIKTAWVSEARLKEIFKHRYRNTQEISHFAKELSHEITDKFDAITDDLFAESTLINEDRAPVIKLLSALFHDALQAGASDIHIEPDQDSLRIRLRIDGLLNEYIFNEKHISVPLIQRLKQSAHLDIAEHRIPLDGSFNFKLNDQNYDARLSTIPTVHGESLVIRLLKQTDTIRSLNQLGMDHEMVQRLENIYQKPYGMLLVTGPTGSGKSTTLYSILSSLNSAERKIITVEDPVEYRMSRLNQIEVNEKIDLSFSRILRAILRQDPDVIMVGEIRDAETAIIALRAAITGHFVLATMHTFDAISAAIRLIDIGAAGFMVATAVKAFIGQRLIRNLCLHCRRDRKLDDAEIAWLEAMQADPQNHVFKDAEGCSHCGFRGYKGRTAIYELLELNHELSSALRHSDINSFIKSASNHEGFRPLARQALDLAKKGITSVHEVIRVVGYLGDTLI